jgi:hypothetical protein
VPLDPRIVGDERRTMRLHVSVHALLKATGDGSEPLAAAPRPSSAIFDIPIDLAQPAELLRTISGWAAEDRTRRVMYVNAHVVNQSRVTPGLDLALQRADLVYCDGYGVRLAARVLDLTSRSTCSAPSHRSHARRRPSCAAGIRGLTWSAPTTGISTSIRLTTSA